LLLLLLLLFDDDWPRVFVGGGKRNTQNKQPSKKAHQRKR